MGHIERKTRITSGGFWLDPPLPKYPYWGIKWYDAAAGQTRRIAARRIDDEGKIIEGREGLIRATGEREQLLAREALARHAEANPQVLRREVLVHPSAALSFALTPESAELLGAQAAAMKAAAPAKKLVAQEDLALLACMVHYKAVKAPKIKATTVHDALRNVQDIWGNPMVSELDDGMQDIFVERLRAQGISDWTILTRLKCIWATLRYCARKKYLQARAIPTRVAANQWDPPAHLPNRNAKLTEEQLVRLFDAAADMESDHAWRYLILAVASVGRPLAPCEVTVQNIDFEAQTLSLLEIEKRGVQSHKRKATVRACPTLMMWLDRWAREVKPTGHEPQFITYQGNRLRSMHFFRALCAKAGVQVPNKAGAYVIRHTMGTWMARCGVPEEERKFMMGQKVAEGSHGFYMHFDPSYLLKAATAIEQLFQLIGARMTSGARKLLAESAATAVIEAPRITLSEQPLPEEMTGLSLRLLLAGNAFETSVAALRGNRIQITQLKQEVR